jgi:hypothetical protein
MAGFNVLGAMTGSWVAMKKGAGFVRILFLLHHGADWQAGLGHGAALATWLNRFCWLK